MNRAVAFSWARHEARTEAAVRAIHRGGGTRCPGVRGEGRSARAPSFLTRDQPEFDEREIYYSEEEEELVVKVVKDQELMKDNQETSETEAVRRRVSELENMVRGLREEVR